MRQAKIRGLKTSWLEANSSTQNETVLFLHGFPDNARAWEPVLNIFSDKYHCIAPFARGLTESPLENQNDRLSLDSQILDIFEILKLTGASGKKIHLVCHDLGAVLGWKLAELLGKNATLTVINGLSLHQFLNRLKNPQQILKSWYIWLFQVPGLMELLLKKNPQFILKRVSALGGRNLHSLSSENLKSFKLYRQYLKESPAEIKQSKKIKAPVLSLNSLNDAFLLPTTLEELERDAEFCEVRILQGQHWIHHEKPQVIAEIILHFIGNKNAQFKHTPEMGL